MHQDSSSDPAHLDELLQHEPALRAAVRAIVGAHDADDVLQATWVKALQRRPPRLRSLRAWLVTVARNEAFGRRRGEGARRAHEGSLERDADSPPWTDAERAEARDLLVAALLRLREPYRRTVRRHFLEGVSIERIARDEQVRVGAVRMRLCRGLAGLRLELRRQLGSDWRERLALAPGLLLAEEGVVAPLPIAGWWLGLVATVVAVGAALWFSRASCDLPVSTSIAAAAQPAASGDSDVPANVSVGAADRTQVLPFGRAVAASVSEGAPVGSVVDPHGRPLAAVDVVVHDRKGSEWVARTDASGSFDLPDGRHGRRLGVGAGYVLLARSREPDAAGLLLVASPAQSVELWVHDRAGRPIEGGTASFGQRFLSTLPLPAHRLGREFPRASMASDVAGRVLFEALPCAGDGWVEIAAAGYRSRQVPVAQLLVDPRIELAESERSEGRILGLVRDALGRPVPGAEVAMGDASTRTSVDGRFVVRHAAASELQVRHAEHGVATIDADRIAFDAATGRGWCTVDLRPTGRMLSGRVRRADGSPAAGVLVFVDDPTWLPPASGSTRRNVVEVAPTSGPADRWEWPLVHARTDGEGHFVVRGLLDRAYQIRVADPRTWTVSPANLVAAGGAELDLQVLAVGLGAVRRLQVLDDEGQPLADATVRVTFRPYADHPGSRTELVRVHLDAHGIGSLGTGSDAVDASLGWIVSVTHPDCLPAAFRLCAEESGHPRVMLRRVHTVHLDLDGWLPPRRDAAFARLLDAEGRTRLVGMHDGERFVYGFAVPFAGDRLPVLHTDRLAARLVIEDACGVLGEWPLVRTGRRLVGR